MLLLQDGSQININETVCVTGAGGFIASWLVKLLLKQGYHVHGTVRNPEDTEKYQHLKELQGAKERLTLFKADLLDYNSLFTAIHGCSGVFHVACPIIPRILSDAKAEILDPAVEGTLNVLEACVKASIRRVIVTSSVVAACVDPNRPRGVLVDENSWSDAEYCREAKSWYILGKTLAEQRAWTYAKEKCLDMVVICPGLVLGPLLQATVNSSTNVLFRLIDGSREMYEKKSYAVVDVRDVAQAHILAYNLPTASGRYLCANIVMSTKDMVDRIAKMYPSRILPVCIKEERHDMEPGNICTKKTLELGLAYIPIDQTLSDAVDSLINKGLLLEIY